MLSPHLTEQTEKDPIDPVQEKPTSGTQFAEQPS